MPTGLSHVTFVVRDLDRMETIVTEVLGAQKVYDSGASSFSLSPERFYLVGDAPHEVWVAIMLGQDAIAQSYNHIAFKISDDEYDARLAAINRLGLSLRPTRPRIAGEARSIYFHDDDNHLIELHTGTLEERLNAYARAKTGP